MSQRRLSASHCRSLAKSTAPSMRTGGRSPRSADCARPRGEASVTSKCKSGVAEGAARSNNPAGVTCSATKNWRHCTRTTRPLRGTRRSVAARSCISTWLISSTRRCCASCTSHCGGCGPCAMRSKTPSRKEKGDCVAIAADYGNVLMGGGAPRHRAGFIAAPAHPPPASRSRHCWAWSCSRPRGKDWGRLKAPHGSFRRIPRSPCRRRPVPRYPEAVLRA